MANFTTEAAVRLKTQLEDSGAVSVALVEDGIAEAHGAIMAELDPSVDTGAPPDGLVRGETLLAGALVLRSLASRSAAEGKSIRVGGQQFDAGKRFGALMALAKAFEQEAWRVLGPYLAAAPGRGVAKTTASVVVMGQD